MSEGQRPWRMATTRTATRKTSARLSTGKTRSMAKVTPPAIATIATAQA